MEQYSVTPNIFEQVKYHNSIASFQSYNQDFPWLDTLFVNPEGEGKVYASQLVLST